MFLNALLTFATEVFPRVPQVIIISTYFRAVRDLRLKILPTAAYPFFSNIPYSEKPSEHFHTHDFFRTVAFIRHRLVITHAVETEEINKTVRTNGPFTRQLDKSKIDRSIFDPSAVTVP